MKVITLKLAALATGLALLTGAAMAQDETTPPAGGQFRMHAGFMGGPEMGMLFHKLNLTAEQKTQIKTMLQSQKAAMKPLIQQEMAAQQQMIKLITSGNFDQTQAAAIAAGESQTHLQLEMAHAKIASEIFETVLTPEQKSQVTTTIAEHQQRMQQRQQKGESAPPSE